MLLYYSTILQYYSPEMRSQVCKQVRSVAIRSQKRKKMKNNIRATVPQLERAWVTDCCVTPHKHWFFSAISWREQVNFQWDDHEVRFVLEQHDYLDLYSASLLKQQSADRYVATRGHIILISNQPGSLSLMLCAWRRSNKYQFHSLWFDPTRARTHYLPHSRRAR